MSRSEEMAQDAVSRYRDALLDGASAAELATLAGALDPGIVRLLHLFRDARRAPSPAPRPSFVDQLERDLIEAFVPASATPMLGGQDVRSRNGRAPHPVTALPAPPTPRRPFRAWLPLAAAILVIVLTGGLVWRSLLDRAPETTIQAMGEPRFEGLVDATVDGAPGGYMPISIERWLFQPGDATLTVPALNGPQWIVAEQSTVVVTVAGQAHALSPGQNLIIPAGQPMQVRDEGPEEASVLRGVASSAFALEQFDRGAITKQVALDSLAHEALPPGRSRITFERITLPPGATLLAEPATGQDWIAVDRGELGLTLLGDGVPAGWTSGRERELAPGDPLPALVPGTHVSLHNLGADSLVLLRLHVTPLDHNGTPTGSLEPQR